MQITLSDDLAKIVTAHAKSRNVSAREAAEALLRTGVSRIKALTKYNKNNGEAKPKKAKAAAKPAKAKKAAKPAKAVKAKPKKAAKPAKAKGVVAQRRAKAKEAPPATSAANGIAKSGGWPASPEVGESSPPASE